MQPKGMNMQPLSTFSHVNSEREKITVDRVMSGPFKGQHLLVIHDDPPSTTTAPMLLDKGTRDWLRSVLDRIEATYNNPAP